jgi:hypothetical protein
VGRADANTFLTNCGVIVVLYAVLARRLAWFFLHGGGWLADKKRDISATKIALGVIGPDPESSFRGERDAAGTF